jgi:K+-transporting ATPase A subunit
MRWTEYTVALLLFSVVSMLVLYRMQRLQHLLPFNPQGLGPVNVLELNLALDDQAGAGSSAKR